MATFSTALLRMVEGVVVDQEGVVRVVVGMGVVMEFVARSAILLTISPAKSVSTAVMLTAGLTVVPIWSTVAVAAVGVTVVVFSSSSNIDEGLNPAARISGSHLILIGAMIT